MSDPIASDPLAEDVEPAGDTGRETGPQRQTESELLFRLSDAANRALALEEIFEPALDAVCEGLRVDRAAVLMNDEKRVMRFRAWRGLSEAYRRAVEGHSPWSPDEPAPRPIFVRDVHAAADLAPHRELFRAEGMGALGFVPLFVQRRLLGKFMVYSREARSFSAREERLASLIASQVAQAIVRFELLESERRERAHAERLAANAGRLHAITAALSKSSTVGEVASVIVDDGAKIAGAATAGLWLVNASGQVAELVRSRDFSERGAARYRRVALDSSLRVPFLDAIRTGEAIWIEGRSALQRSYPEAASVAAPRPELAVAALPLLVDGRCLGCLAFSFDEVHEFSSEERHPLLVVARLCAQAVGRARLFDLEARARGEAEAAQKRTEFLLEASVLLSSSLDFEETLERLAELAVPRLADWCSIELATDPAAPSQQLAVRHKDPAKVELARELRRRWPPAPDAPRGPERVIKTGRSELYGEVTDDLLVEVARDPEHLGTLRSLGFASAMVVPMPARGRTFGAITFVSSESARRFGPKDVELAELLGRRAGIAIDNALLYRSAQAATRAREQVLAVVSHDLRNPLSVVQLGAANLERALPGDAGASLRRSVQSIQRSGESMSRLIQDLVEFAGMESGRFRVEPTPNEPAEIASAAVEMLAGVAEERRVRLAATTVGPLPPVLCDRDRTIQALANLVSNAVKVTPEGGAVSVSAEVRDGALWFHVADTGPGIPESSRSRLFQPYWRGENPGYRGTGLGLAIVKGIVDAHGGRIAVESTPGAGSRFSIGLCLDSRGAAPTGPPRASMATPAPRAQAARPEDCLKGGGEMGALMRSLDWSRTSVGPVDRWPQSLRTAVSLLLESRFPMYIAWGPDFVQFYNDGYRPILGSTKHPALGKSTRETFAEIWPIIGPMFTGVMEGTAVGLDDFMLPLDRHGFTEECYFTLSYSPIRDESGGVGGVNVTVTETTARVLGERRLGTLRDLAARATETTEEASAWTGIGSVLASRAADMPFVLLYVLDAGEKTATLAASAGVEAGSRAAPASLSLERDEVWPLARAARSGHLEVLDPLDPRLGPLVGSAWPEPVARAVLVPIARSDEARPYGFLVAGVSPRRTLDESYRDFFELVADHAATAIGNARAHDEERRRAESLAELDRAKTAFFSNVSHEFRTPLTLMLGPLEDLRAEANGALNEPQRRNAETAHRNAQRLLKLVNTLLDFARIEAGRARASFEATDLAQLTGELASAFRSAIERAGLGYVVECEPLPELVHVDRDMWERIVLNLISNAFKYTFEGEVRVSLRWKGDRVVLEVRDTGVGIASHELPNLFKRFHRVEGGRARTHEGSGIGLALVQELARLHGGDVSVESEPGRGSAFTVTILAGTRHLPADHIAAPRTLARTALGARPYVDEALRWLPDAPARAGASAALETPAAPQRGTEVVLIADDNADMRDYMKRIVGAHWNVEAVADGAAALAAARARTPDLIVTDVMMPALDGFGLLAALRADPRTRSIPVMMVTARAGDEARVEGLSAGADDYLTKPFSARELLARVRTQLTLSRARRALEESTGHLFELFRQAPAPICVIRGPDLVFEMANDLYHQVTGRRDLAGKRLLDAMPELAGLGFDDLLRQVMSTGAPYTGTEVPIRLDTTGSGTLRETFFTFTYAPLKDAAGRTERVMVICAEVSEHVRHRRELDAALGRAESASRAKDEFLAMLGHELRNPLAPILTALQLMRLRSESAFPKEREVIERQVDHLRRLVDDLLDVSRLTRGKIALARKRVSLQAVVGKALEMASPLIEERRHDVSVSLPPDDLVVSGDEQRLVQVLVNLLSNAAKYSDPEHRIRVSGGREGDEVWLSVADDGVGIEPALLPRVFDLFVQGHRESDRTQGGLGLGLAIVRSLVELHGGTVTASSAGAGRGTELRVRLPAAPVEPGAAARADDSARLAREGRRVLVVDDNRDAAELLAEGLEALGHVTRVAFDGPSALRAAEDFAPEVALLDLGLPVMDGHELAQRLRQLPSCRDCTLVAVSGYGLESDRARSAAAGFARHFVKPVELDQISAAIQRR